MAFKGLHQIIGSYYWLPLHVEEITINVEDPKPFGVVKVDATGHITDFVEKPEHFVSDLAIIGIYYFKDGEYLKKELQYLIDNNIKDKGEFQLTNALDNMKDHTFQY